MEKLFSQIFLLAFVATSVPQSSGQVYENASQLHTDLLANYNVNILPKNNQSEKMMVNVMLILNGIMNFDSVGGIITAVLGMRCQWTDERLKWNPADYDGIDETYFIQDDIWTPTFILGNPTEFTVLGHDWNRVTMDANGSATYVPANVVSASCLLNMKFWPFDKQVCKLSFLEIGFPPEKLQLNMVTGGFIFLENVKNSEWTVEEVTCETTTTLDSAEISYNLYMKRNPNFYFMSIILPLIGLFVVSSLVFILPQDSGERIGYSITIVLALAVFLTVVAQEMPKAAEPQAVICVFILLGVIYSIISMILVIINMRWYFNTADQPLSSYHRFLVRIARMPCKNKVADEQANENGRRSSQRILVTEKDDKNKDFLSSRGSSRLSDESFITWQDVSSAVDKICFIFFFSTSVIQSVGFMIYLAGGSDYDESFLDS